MRVQTVATVGYLPFVSVLLESLRKTDPGNDYSILVTDSTATNLRRIRDYLIDDDVEWLSCEQLDAPELAGARDYYSALEFNSACKVLALAHQLDTGNEECLFLDPDMLALGSVAHRVRAVGCEVVVTPHTRAPFPVDGAAPTDLEMAVTGSVNGGVVYARSAAGTSEALRWLRAQIPYRWFVAPHLGMYADQRWLSLLPDLFPATAIVLKDPTLNIAYWNLHERKLRFDGERLLVSGSADQWEPARLIHFSGVDVDGDGTLTRHSSRSYGPETDAAMKRQICEYAPRVKAERARLQDLRLCGDLGFASGPLAVRMTRAHRRWTAPASERVPIPGHFERLGRALDQVFRRR